MLAELGLCWGHWLGSLKGQPLAGHAAACAWLPLHCFPAPFYCLPGACWVNFWQLGSATWPSGQEQTSSVLTGGLFPLTPPLKCPCSTPEEADVMGGWEAVAPGPVPTSGGRKFLGAVLLICRPLESWTKKKPWI